MRSRLLLRSAFLPVALVAAACGGASTRTTRPSAPGSAVTLSARSIKGLGTVLVNGQGRTLYTFAPDRARKVRCTGTCANVWPPLNMAAGGKPSVSGGVKASLVSSDPDPSGGRVVTYKGWPLYLYQVDALPGSDKGQAVHSAGGVFYAMSPSGTRLKKRVKSGVHAPVY